MIKLIRLEWKKNNIASFIVSAYKNKTMNLMFSYPIKRQKILAAQMLAGNAVFPIILTVISLIFAGLSICNAETKDLQ